MDSKNLDRSGCGVLYVATGHRFVEEARASLESLRAHHPDLPAILFTDLESPATGGFFSEIRRIACPTNSFADKIPPLTESPFQRSLFLDTDTRVCAPLDSVFQFLDRVDLAAAQAPMRVTWPQPDIPEAFPEVNSGVIAWRRSAETDSLFSEWRRLYGEHVAATGQKDDQPALRRALYKSRVRLGILPPEYNFRTVLPGFAGRGPVCILHGRHADMAAVERCVNRHHGCRVVLPGDREWAPDRLIALSGGIRIPAAALQWLAASWFQGLAVLTKLKRSWLR